MKNETVVCDSEVLESGSRTDKDERRKKRILIIIIILLVLLLGVLSSIFIINNLNQGNGDAGATIKSSNTKTVDEIRSELDKQVEDSKMTISVSSKCKIKDGKVRVNVINAEGNKFDQSFELIQNNKVIYSSGLIRPGEGVEWCDAPSAVAGDAIIKISPHVSGEKVVSGNPQSAQVKLVVD